VCLSLLITLVVVGPWKRSFAMLISLSAVQKPSPFTRPEVSSYPPRNIAMLHCMSVDKIMGQHVRGGTAPPILTLGSRWGERSP